MSSWYRRLRPPMPPSSWLPCDRLCHRGRSCRALPQCRTGRQRRPWSCHVRRHCPPGHPRCGQVHPRSTRKTSPPLFRSSPPPMLRVPARLPPPWTVRPRRGSPCRSRLEHHPRPASDMFLLSSVVCFLYCSLAVAIERPPG
jgi:hypothetical protein